MARSSAAPRWVGILPKEAASTRLVAAILLEQNDESSVQRTRYMTLETIAPLRDDLSLMLAAARRMDNSGSTHHGDPGLNSHTTSGITTALLDGRDPFG